MHLRPLLGQPNGFGYTFAIMFRRRSLQRCTTALVTVVSLLLSQLALGSYVCPGTADRAMSAVMAASDEPCEGMDPAQPALCHQQSASPAQTVEAAKVVAPSLPAVVHMWVIVPVVVTTGAAAVVRLASAEAWPPPGRLFLSTRRFRV